MKIYAIYDKLIGYQNPWLNHSNATAIRTAKAAIAQNQVENAEDKQLFCLGDFNEKSGEINYNQEFVINLVDLKEIKENVL